MDVTKIYGIEFDAQIPSGGEYRILDAQTLQNDYVIGSKFQRNGGVNDFDKAYPFGAIRLCNVSIADGQRRIVYEGEEGFTRFGSNVMVEIPKFYSKREKCGSEERWMVSGTKHPGFETEPAFCRSGRELDTVYVGAYNAQNQGGGVFSASGGFPDVCKTRGEFAKEFAEVGFDPYDLAIHLCLQKLIVIEFGTRYVKQHLGSIGFLRYFSRVNDRNQVCAMGPNTVTIPYAPETAYGKRSVYFAPGHNIGFGHTEFCLDHRRTVTDVRFVEGDTSHVVITYDGEDLQGIIQPEVDAVFGVPQCNGKTDTLPYHTGRCDLHCPLAGETDYLLNAFRYRGIENVWGNVWEHMEGLRICNLRYHYTFEPELYEADVAQWNTLSYEAPEQHLLAVKTNKLWVSSLGMDENAPLVMLPCGIEDATPGKFYDSAIYTYKDRDYSNKEVDPNTVWGFTVGGGFDHSVYGSLFTYRGFMAPNANNWLYSSRVCLR